MRTPDEVIGLRSRFHLPDRQTAKPVRRSEAWPAATGSGRTVFYKKTSEEPKAVPRCSHRAGTGRPHPRHQASSEMCPAPRKESVHDHC